MTMNADSKDGKKAAKSRKVPAKRRSSTKKKTHRYEEPSLSASQIYMRNIVDFSLLNREEEKELADSIHNGTEAEREHAREILIKSNLRLVVKLANQFLGRGLSKEDLISEGNIGLTIAVERFDPGKGAKFSTYSTWWIKQAMRRAIAEQSKTIRIPLQSADKINKIIHAERIIQRKHNEVPTNEQIAERTGFSERTVKELRHAWVMTSSLNEPLVKDESGEVQDMIMDVNSESPDEELVNFESVSRLRELIDEKLDEREKTIIVMRYGLDGDGVKTLDDVGEAVGCTRERVRQIQNRALRKLMVVKDDVDLPGSKDKDKY